MKERIQKYKGYHRQGILFKMMIRKFVNKTRPFWIYIMKFFPIDQNKVCFDSFEGTGFGGDPKYICLELIKRKPNLKIIWFVRKKQDNFPTNIKQIYIDSVAAIYHQSTAKVWVDNTRTGHRTKKRSNQKYLQTWHGNLLGKKVERDAEQNLWPEYIPIAKYDGAITDAFIVANQKCMELAMHSFWLNKDVEYLKIGAPSNDVLVNRNDDLVYKNKIRNILDIDDDAYIVLYAPSFRDDGSTDGYDFDFESLIKIFEKKTKKKCVLLVRFHPDVVQHEELLSHSDKIINATRYPDSKELALISDCIITDYSSIAYDFLILRKAVFRECLDFEHYKSLRDVYDEFYQMPYGLCLTKKQLRETILNFDDQEYQNKLDEYFRYNKVYDTGNASQAAADWILNQIQ